MAQYVVNVPALIVLRRPHNQFICSECRTAHDGQPEGCAGGTWCDCGHRPPRPRV